MDKVDMSLDDIIKLNKKAKKQNGQTGGRKKQNQAVKTQNKIKQFRGRPVFSGNQTTRQRGKRKFNSVKQQQQVVNNFNQGKSPLNRLTAAKKQFIKTQTFRARNNYNNNNFAQKQRNNVKKKQQGATVQQFKQASVKQSVQQGQRQSRQNRFNQARKLPQLQTQNNISQKKLNRTVGMMRSDQILQQKAKQQQMMNQQQQQMMNHQQQQGSQKKGRRRRRWGRRTESDPDAIMTISVANVEKSNDVQVVMGKPRQRRPRLNRIQQQIQQIQHATHTPSDDIDVVLTKPRQGKPRLNRIQQQIRQLQQKAHQQQTNDVQVVVPNQPRRRRLRRNRQNSANQIPVQHVQTSPQQPSLSEQIKLMQPTVSQTYNFNRTDFGKGQTGMLLTDRFGSPAGTSSSDSQAVPSRVILF